MEKANLQENVILVDADHVDEVAGRLSKNFEQMIGRAIPQTDLAEWLVCCALDGEVPESNGVVQCVLLYSPERPVLQHFKPGRISEEIDGAAFMDTHLGEFQLSAVPVETVSAEELFAQCAEVILDSEEAKRVILIPNHEMPNEDLARMLTDIPEGKQVTVLTMTPSEAKNHREDMLGFGLMHAMGIQPEEIK